MPCNYLLKLESDEKYTHQISEGCQSSTVHQAVVRFWLDRHPGVKASNFADRVAAEKLSTRVVAKHIQGVSIVDETFEVILQKRPAIVGPGQSPPAAPVEVTALVARTLSAKVELISWFAGLC